MSPTFRELGVPADLISVLDARGITSPFPIQASTLPDALDGRDVCGKAPTGSGKTIAFGVPLVALVGDAKPRRPRGLVLVPTRELANQVCDELNPLASTRRRTVAAVFGGTGYDKQRKALQRGVDILVACPGRLEDLLAQGDLRLSEVSFVVIDEADRMADMGFLPAVKRILDLTSSNRQTLLFSATLDGDVDVLIKRYQTNPSHHEVEAPDDNGDVNHLFWKVDRHDRVKLTAQLIARHGPTIVFCRTRHGADRVTRQLGTAGIDAVAIHGSRSQPQRERALAAFISGRAQALIATDVAARGIHVDDVSCVVHFDPPGDEKDYVHRSGRTGRAGADGTVVSLVSNDQFKAVRSLQRAVGLPDHIGPADTMADPPPSKRRPIDDSPSPTNKYRGKGGPKSSGNRGGSGKPRNGRPGAPSGDKRRASQPGHAKSSGSGSRNRSGGRHQPA